jgi:hypothetical protein
MSAGNQGAQRGVESWLQLGDVVENDEGVGQRFEIGAHCQCSAVVVKAGDPCRAKEFLSAIDFAYQYGGQSSCEPLGLVAGEGDMAGAMRQLGRVSVLMAACFTFCDKEGDQVRGSRQAGPASRCAAR